MQEKKRLLIRREKWVDIKEEKKYEIKVIGG